MKKTLLIFALAASLLLSASCAAGAPPSDTAPATSADPAPDTAPETTPAETTKTDEGALPMTTVFTNPVAPGADPFVFKDDDGT